MDFEKQLQYYLYYEHTQKFPFQPIMHAGAASLRVVARSDPTENTTIETFNRKDAHNEESPVQSSNIMDILNGLVGQAGGDPTLSSNSGESRAEKTSTTKKLQ